jgi:hypothetical protein
MEFKTLDLRSRAKLNFQQCHCPTDLPENNCRRKRKVEFWPSSTQLNTRNYQECHGITDNGFRRSGEGRKGPRSAPSAKREREETNMNAHSWNIPSLTIEQRPGKNEREINTLPSRWQSLQLGLSSSQTLREGAPEHH